MKHVKKGLFSIIVMAVLSWAVHGNTSGQARPSQAERQVWMVQGEAFAVGQTVRYKLHASKHFDQGRIFMVTDSTLLFETNIPGMVITIRHEDIEAFKIQKKREHIGQSVLGGIGLVLIGGLIVVATDAWVDTNSLKSGTKPGVQGTTVLGWVFIAGGIVCIILPAIPETQTVYPPKPINTNGLHN